MKSMSYFILIFCFALSGLISCASSEVEESHYRSPSKAKSAAYSFEDFYIDPPAPYREVPSGDIDFWIGGCSRDTAGNHYSRSSYSCANR